MPGFVTKVQVKAPIEVVFAGVLDFANNAERISGIESVEMLTEGPTRVGTRFRETRIMFGRKATEEMEVVELKAPKMYAIGAESHGCSYYTEVHLRELEGGTELEMDFRAEALTFGARLMSFVMKPLMKSCQRAMDKDLDDLRISIETGELGQKAIEATA